MSLDISSSKSRTFQPQHPLESTRFPMARARTPLLSLGRLRTRNTQQRSSTNVTRHGAASLLEIAQPRPLPTRSQCELTLFVVPDTKTKSIYKKSRNLTQSSSPGLVTRNDPVYANLPADSRQPPAPIDPSSKRFFFALRFNCFNSLSSQSRSGSISHPSRFRGRTKRKNNVLDS